MIKHLKDWGVFLTVAILLITLLSVSYWYVRIRPIDLTDKYGTELAESLEYIEQTIANYETAQGVETLTDVATGDYLEALLEYRIDCSHCRFRVLVINVHVSNLKIVSYSQYRAKILARIETANVSIERSTGQVRTPCYGLATEEIIVLIKEEGKWKISGGEAGEIDTWTPVEALRESVCPTNWEEVLNNFLIATP